MAILIFILPNSDSGSLSATFCMANDFVIARGFTTGLSECHEQLPEDIGYAEFAKGVLSEHNSTYRLEGRIRAFASQIDECASLISVRPSCLARSVLFLRRRLSSSLLTSPRNVGARVSLVCSVD